MEPLNMSSTRHGLQHNWHKNKSKHESGKAGVGVGGTCAGRLPSLGSRLLFPTPAGPR